MIPISKGLCLPSSATVQELFLLARDGGVVPDISLDPALTTFLSLDSSSALQHQYSSLQHGLSEQQRAAFNHNLTSALGGSSRVSYGGVGVVALAMSLLMDLLVQQVRSPSSGRVNSGRASPRMFGISSASRIGSIVNGYLGQLPGAANDREKMAEVTALYDSWLKLELLDHYERMTNKKKRMGSEAMQQWLAGSAVHLHVRLHQIRLGSVPPGSAESLRLSYKTGFSRLVQAYTAYLRRNVRETATPRGPAGKSPGRGTSAGAGGADGTSAGAGGADGTSAGAGGADGTSAGAGGADGTSAGAGGADGTSAGAGGADGTSAGAGGADGTSAGADGADGTSAGAGGADGTSAGADGAALQGLLSVEPLRNVSHSVRHRPCESPAIAEGLVTRIMAAQDLEGSRRFYRYAEVNFDSLVAQLEDFELDLTPEVIS